MDTTLAFVVSFGMAVSNQVADDGEKLQFAAARPMQLQAQPIENRADETRKRIELTNQWTRQMRQAGIQR